MSKEPATHRSPRAPVWRTSALSVAAAVLAGCALMARETTIAYMAVNSHFSPRKVEIEISRSFIETYKDRVAIRTSFIVILGVYTD